MQQWNLKGLKDQKLETKKVLLVFSFKPDNGMIVFWWIKIFKYVSVKYISVNVIWQYKLMHIRNTIVELRSDGNFEWKKIYTYST